MPWARLDTRPVLSVLLMAALALTPSRTTVAQDLDVPYFPTPQAAVDKMLEMANVGPDDFLIDLGSGDGRIAITAAKTYGTRALGVDLDPARVMESNESAKREKVSDRVTFAQQDLFETDLSEATVITMFLLTSINMKLRPKLLGLKPGTRIVSYSFNMGDWPADRTEVVGGRKIYLWVVREGLGGTLPAASGAE